MAGHPLLLEIGQESIHRHLAAREVVGARQARDNLFSQTARSKHDSLAGDGNREIVDRDQPFGGHAGATAKRDFVRT